MLIKPNRPWNIPGAFAAAEHVALDRRTLLTGAGVLGAAAIGWPLLGKRRLSTQAVEDDTDLFFGRELPPRGAADVFDELLGRRVGGVGFLSHLRSMKGYDEPKILRTSSRQVYLTGADVGQIR